MLLDLEKPGPAALYQLSTKTRFAISREHICCLCDISLLENVAVDLKSVLVMEKGKKRYIRICDGI